MTPQIMGPKMNAHHAARLGHHFPRCLITYRKNPLIGLNPFSSDIVLESVGKLLRDEDEFLLPATLEISEGQSSLRNVRGGKGGCLGLIYRPESQSRRKEPVLAFLFHLEVAVSFSLFDTPVLSP